MLGLATTVLDVLHGRLRALPGGPNVFVPVVTVDYLTRFLVLLPTLKCAANGSYWVLDPDTPCLPDLLHLIGTHHQMKIPSLRVPVRLIKTLPRRLTHADPGRLSFLSTDRYPTGPAEDLARAAGLHHADVALALCRWSDHLVRGEAPAPRGQRSSAPSSGVGH